MSTRCISTVFMSLVCLLALSACGGGGTPTSTVSVESSSSASSSSTSSVSSSASSSSVAAASMVFALLDPGETPTSMTQLAALSSVDGLAFRTRWNILEPSDGVYNWSSLDTALDTVGAQGKQLTVHVGVSGGAWPQWLQSAGAQTYTYSSPQGTVTDPLPWDAVFLSRYADFVTMLAAHIQDRGDMARLHAVSVGAPVSEMSLVGCQNGVMTGGVAYSRSTYLQAWRATVADFASVFTTTPILVSAPVPVICTPDNDGKAFYTDLMSYAITLNGHAAIFAADLNALGSFRMQQVDTTISSQLPVNFQMVWSATSDPTNKMQGTLHDAICKGIGYGTHYFEIYKSDLLSTDSSIQSAIATARSGAGCP